MAASNQSSRIIDNEMSLIRPSLERMLDSLTMDQERKLGQERMAHAREIEVLRNRINELLAQGNTLDALLQAARHQIERLETDKTNLQKGIDEAKEENTTLQKEMERLNRVIVKDAKDAEEERSKLDAALAEAKMFKESMKNARRLMKKATFLLKGVSIPEGDASTSSSSSVGSPTRRRCNAGRRRSG